MNPTKPFKTIVACTDFSDCGNRAVSAAFALAGAGPAKVILVHAVEPALRPVSWYGGLVPEVTCNPETTRRVVEEAEEHLDALAPDGANERGIAVVSTAPLGAPVEQILRVAKEYSADVVVIGTHGRTGLPRLLIGSVAERVVRLAELPVLVVH